MERQETTGEMAIKVRAAAPADVKAVCAMVRAHNEEAGQSASRPDPRTFRALAFGKNAFVMCEVAEVTDEEGAVSVIGHAIWHDCFSTDDGTRGGYLVDLFVEPAWRREGVGTMLMRATCRRVKARGGSHLWWATMPKNQAGRRFYVQFNATDDPAHAHAVYGANFLKLATGR
ncbi:MAG: GNAT family N-acetyltransferase [Alphaproteobacteria bacterium]|nr:GNAT family N-acetyltransferase [Alphaproteobacteria bacterium]